MEKAIKLLGGQKNGTPNTGIFEIWNLLRNIALIVVSFCSIAFALGNYVGNAKDLPERIDKIENRMTISETKDGEVLAALGDLRADIRELRACILRGDR